jgi:hypothetical protein
MDTEYSFGDVWFYIYGGMEKFTPSLGNYFQFPIVWTTVFVLGALLVLHYPVRDMLGIGAHYLVSGGSRLRWWLSKVIWNIVSTVLYHLIIILCMGVICLLFQFPMKLGLNISLVEILFEFKQGVELYFISAIPVSVLLLPIAISVAMNLFQMTLTLFLNPTYSFFANCVLLISSAYIMTPFLPYNYAMPLRYSWIYMYGFSYHYGYIVAGIIAVLSIIIGFIRFARYDIIKKEDN